MGERRDTKTLRADTGSRPSMEKYLMLREIVMRYEAGGNALDLTVDKWVRIREDLESAITLLEFREILQGLRRGGKIYFALFEKKR